MSLGVIGYMALTMGVLEKMWLMEFSPTSPLGLFGGWVFWYLDFVFRVKSGGLVICG